MTPFEDDPRPVYTDVLDVPSPLTGELLFDIPMSHRKIGDGWMIWSHGYLGDVYYTKGEETLTLTLPQNTSAFYFYVQPNCDHGWFEVIADDGTSSGSIFIDWSTGAEYFGFYGIDGDAVSAITITGVCDFAIGEFGIAAIPAPGMLTLLTAAGLLPNRRRR